MAWQPLSEVIVPVTSHDPLLFAIAGAIDDAVTEPWKYSMPPPVLVIVEL
jgi:hypothetical protein